MGQSTGRITSEGDSSSKTTVKGPSVQADVTGEGKGERLSLSPKDESGNRSIVTPGTPNHKQPEGRFDSATPTRLDSRENLIDTQSNDSDPQLFPVKPDLTAQGGGQLMVRRGEKVQVMEFSDEEEWEINRSNIKMGQKLKGGLYKDVHKGTYLKTGQTVIVNTFGEEKTDEFLKGAAVMKKVRHAHLVQLLGVCTRELPFFIVTEYMPKGNLRDYIRGPEGRNLDAVTLVYMSQQIASAMAYLEKQGIIHRDLMAWNCLVGNGYLVKVANLHHSRFVENGIYVAPEVTQFPVKWTAPESMLYNKLSIKSNIWSFGVLLWELTSRGRFPYPGMTNADALEQVTMGYRMECPEGCPSNIYDMMKRCWEDDPQQRPWFTELHDELNAMSNVRDEWEMNHSNIEMGQNLEGEQYGEAYKGTYLKTGQSVIVKLFREEKTDEFLKEAAVMKKVRHAHLVQLLGVCTREQPFFIVTAYMPKGNLRDYIRGPEGRNLDVVTLVCMSQQIASAMAYLEEQGIIHRDLAARNCLVGNGYLVKVANLCYSQFVEDGIFYAPEGTKVPMKWTAPEGLFYSQFSIKSDVWSFGVLLWELTSRGMVPYRGMSNDEVQERVPKGYRLECPEGCPSNIYDMMKRCWEENPQQRPPFSELHQELNAMSSNVTEGVLTIPAHVSTPDEWEINRSNIEMGQKLEGEQYYYGEAYKGTYLKTGQSVIVKTFREEKTAEFLNEAAVMKKVRHAHLVQLLGVFTEELPFFIVTEYMSKGNLREYLRGPEGRNLDAVALVYMSQQIASAMAYLEEQGFIHRDLAARNCLVGNGHLVKVANLHKSQFVEDGVYDDPEGIMIPVRWTAPEGLLSNQFSIKSDIWAFGVLLWELTSQGKNPYHGMSNHEMFEQVTKGYRLECPESCPSKFYEMMKRCWESDPQQRPRFAEVHQELNAMSSNVTEGFKESDCSALYHKAVRDNPTITLHIAKAMTIGPPRVGKTSLRHHLLGLPPPEISSSTPVMRTAEIVSMCQTDSTTSPDEVDLVPASGAVPSDDCSPGSDSEASSGDLDDGRDDLGQTVVNRSRYEAGMYIADGRKWVLVNSASGMLSLLTFLQQKADIAATQPPQNSRVSEDGHIEAPVQSLGDIPHPVESNSKSDIIHPMHAKMQEPEIAKITVPDANFKAPPSSEKSPTPVVNVIRQLYHELQKPDIANVTLPDAHLLQFLDCGGQLAYHDILPLFVNIPAIYLHVFNMTKELTECPVDELCSPKGEKKYSAKSALSVVEMIKRSVMTVHSLADKKVQLPSEVKLCESKCTEAHVVLVGTHLDKLVETGRDAKLKAINELLRKALQSRSHDLEGMVVKNPKRCIMFYPVNNMSHKNGNLKKQIRQQAKEDAVKVKVPVKWYLRQLLEMSQGEEKPLYSYSELYQRCKDEGSIADIGEFHAMVTYFHALGLLIHLCGADVGHTEDSDCLVFTNPSYLFENISKLYQVQFEEEVQGKGKIAFKYEGKLTKEALRDLRVDEDHLSHDHFLDLLVQLFIGAEIEVHEGDRTLFVPSVLTDLAEDATPSIDSAPKEHSLCFAVTFKHTSFIPCGVFTGMIARLQSAPCWEICTSSISRVLMKFSVGALGTVNVLDHATHISAEITCCEGLKRGQYQEYRDTILQAAAESYCFLFHSKNAKDPQSGTCRICVDRPYLVLGQTCHWCPPQPDGTRKVQHFAELKVENCVPVTVRCQETMEPKVLEDTVLERVPFQNISHYAVVKEQHTSPPQEVVVAKKVPAHISPVTAEQVLDQFRDRFIEEIDANTVVRELEYQEFISDGDQTTISQTKSAKQQNQILHAQLKKTCTTKALMGVCDIITAVKGNPRMKNLGVDIQKELEKVTRTLSPSTDPLRDELLSSRPTAVLLMKKVVPAVAHKWHPLGVCLGMEAAILNTYKATESRSVELCCLEMFECWLQDGRGTGESPRTWSTVLTVIGDCLGQDVATCTEEALLEESHRGSRAVSEESPEREGREKDAIYFPLT